MGGRSWGAIGALGAAATSSADTVSQATTTAIGESMDITTVPWCTHAQAQRPSAQQSLSESAGSLFAAAACLRLSWQPPCASDVGVAAEAAVAS